MPLANDALQDLVSKKYIGVGLNSAQRIAEALRWA